MGRSALLAIGAVSAAAACEQVGVSRVGALVALSLAALLIAGEVVSARRVRQGLPIVIGAGLIVLRLTVFPVAAPPHGVPPSDFRAWPLVVLATGSPRDGHQTATLATRPEAEVPFTVAATLPRFPEVLPGDQVVVEGQIREPPNSPYGEYLRRIGAAGTISARTLSVEAGSPGIGGQLEQLRRAAAEALAKVLPEPEAGLAAGILIGLRDRVDRAVAADFTTAGVSHVVAISGWNIAIVAAAIAALAGRMRRRRRAIVTVLAIVAYVAFAGASASVVRAAAMAGVVLLARESGRAGRAAAALGWAATLLLLSDPSLISDAGFQLSSLATAGLIAWGTPLTERIDRLGRGHLPTWLSESLGVSLAAQAATLPIILASFGRLAALSPLVNLVVVPMVAPAMAAGLIALAGGGLVAAGFPSELGAVLGAPGWVILRILVGIVQAAADLPFASVALEPPMDAVAAAASVVAIVAVVHWRRGAAAGGGSRIEPRSAASASSRRPPAAGNGARRAAASALIVAVVVTGGVFASRGGGVARITILDVGQGDSILVEGSGGGRLLVDGGPDPDRLLVALDERIPPWDRRIDVVVLSHPHEDHLAGLNLVLARYRVGTVLEPGTLGSGPSFVEWAARLARPDAPSRRTVSADDRIAIDEIEVRVIWPRRSEVPAGPIDNGAELNNLSVVLLGRVGQRAFLLPGDIEEGVDPLLMTSGLPRVDLLKVAHHGSRTATTPAFVDAVRPRIAVASAGVGNTYGHPTRETLARLAAVGSRILRTDRDGSVVVEFVSDGLAVRAEGADAGGRRALGYHRIDDRARAGGGRRSPALPGSPTLVRAPFARRRRGRGLAGRSDCFEGRRCRPSARGGCGPAPRHRQGAAREPPGPRAPPRRRLGCLADVGGPSGARAGSRRPSGDAASGRRGVPALGRICLARGTDRGLRGQTSRSAPRIDGRAVRLVATPIPDRVGRRLERVGPRASS